MARNAACLPEQLCSSGLNFDMGHFKLFMSMSYSHKILKASLVWILDPLCEPHANAIDFELLLIFGGEDFSENPSLSDDHVDANDKPFLTSFPYLASPW